MNKKKKTVPELMAELQELQHAMQSGVAMMMNYVHEPTSPKHLRVGINVALSGHAALGKLLIDKGLITEEEFFEGAIEAMKQEVKQYELEITERNDGANIKLG